MSIEALLTAHTEALNANTEALNANTEALLRVAGNQERLIAGQAAAIEKVEAPKATRTRKKADEPATETEQPEPAPQGNAEPAPTASGAAAAANASSDDGDGPTEDQLKQTATAWMGTTEEQDEKVKRATFLQEAAASITGETPGKIFLTGENSKLGAAGRKKMVFFIKRAHKLGGIQHVDLKAPYDFDGPADQDAPRVETAAPAFDPLA